jgi:DNA (cytosine-5)-methyltransferase 1
MAEAVAYYNEPDPYCAQWLRNLIDAGHIAPGDVDERDIRDVQPDDVAKYRQCHFFAGIGVWSYALRLAGWPDDRPVWTGSCPCQGLSTATRGRPTQEDLWPYWFRFFTSNRPAAVFGEQVASKRAWLDQVCSDLEGLDYAVGAAVLPAVSVAFDHARHRIYFAAHPNDQGQSGMSFNAEVARGTQHRHFTRSNPGAYGHTPRVGRLRAYGNAIVAPLAAEFVSAYMEACDA